MVFSTLSIVVTVVSMCTAKSLVNSQNYYSIELDVKGAMISSNIKVCRNNVKQIERQIEAILGLRQNLVEITRPINISNGVRLHINVYIGYTKVIDMNIEKLINNANDSGQLSNIMVESWNLSQKPDIDRIKCEMHESKIRKKQLVNIKIKSKNSVEMAHVNHPNQHKEPGDNINFHQVIENKALPAEVEADDHIDNLITGTTTSENKYKEEGQDDLINWIATKLATAADLDQECEPEIILSTEIEMENPKTNFPGSPVFDDFGEFEGSKDSSNSTI